LLAGGLWREAFEARESSALARLEARAVEKRYERIAAALPAIPSSVENLKATVDEFRRVAARSASPEAMLAQLSRALERQRNIQIEALDWNAAPPEAQPSGAQPARATAPATNEAAESLEIAGRIDSPRADPRSIVEEIERFAQALREAGLQPGKAKLPFDVAPESVLSGDSRSDAAQSGATRFSLVVSKAKP
jgi:hypothetical protein